MLGAIKFKEFEKPNRIVIAERIDKPGFAELLLVSDADGDFAPLQNGFFGPLVTSTEHIKEIVSRSYSKLPCTIVQISHKTKDMPFEKACSIIMGREDVYVER